MGTSWHSKHEDRTPAGKHPVLIISSMVLNIAGWAAL
jgi:hypothetical protein